eukprot:COSAG06_NODE_61972_length_266_cov_0.622754_1_plen_27_part_10
MGARYMRGDRSGLWLCESSLRDALQVD